MSLKDFVRQPAIRQALKTFAIRERTPPILRRAAIQVTNANVEYGLIGTAFDYLARFQVARELLQASVHVYGSELVSSYCEQLLPKLCVGLPKQHKRWRAIFSEAKAHAAEFIVGKGDDLLRLIELSQYLAHADIVVRRGPWDFNPKFQETPAVTDELLRMFELFKPSWRFAPRKICLLNPCFVASGEVGGADADLVIDNMLVDFKTTKRNSVDTDDFLQLLGYAALARQGGFIAGNKVHSIQIEEIAMYFARYGVLARWRLDTLFPRGTFERFCEIFEREIETYDPLQEAGI